MKRALALGFGLALAAAAPAQADQVVDGRADLTWDKPSVAIAVGETVTWTFSDTTQTHNVQSDLRDPADAKWDFATLPAQPATPASMSAR